MNKHNKTETVTYTEDKQVVAKGEGSWGRKERSETDKEVQTSCCKINVTSMKYAVWNIIETMQYINMVTYCDLTYCSGHFEMFRNSKALCCITGTNLVL